MERTAYISDTTDCSKPGRGTDEYLYTEINAVDDTFSGSRTPLTPFEKILNDPELHKSMHTPDYFMLVE